MNEARSLSYSIQQTERSFQALYPKTYANWSSSQIASATQQQWQNSRAAFVDALLMQSKIVETIEKDAGLLDQLVGQSQSAPGSLSATQAGNQIMALTAKQVMQMQQLMATQFRAEMLERARQLAVEQEGVELHKRFVGSGSAYTGNGQGD
jgi:P-type conjugative transfer protein TrbJ